MTSWVCLAAKAVLNELKDLLADITNAIQSIYGNLSDLDFDVKLDEQVTYDDLVIFIF